MIMLDEEKAVKYGLKEAVILSKLMYFTALNKKRKVNSHNGKTWCFNSRRGWRTLFPFFSDMQIWRSFRSLEEQGAIFSDSFNKRAYDKTKWYRVNSDLYKESLGIFKNEITDFKNEITDFKNAKPIQDNNNIIKTPKPY